MSAGEDTGVVSADEGLIGRWLLKLLSTSSEAERCDDMGVLDQAEEDAVCS